MFFKSQAHFAVLARCIVLRLPRPCEKRASFAVIPSRAWLWQPWAFAVFASTYGLAYSALLPDEPSLDRRCWEWQLGAANAKADGGQRLRSPNALPKNKLSIDAVRSARRIEAGPKSKNEDIRVIVTLTANACLDHTAYVPSLASPATETPLRECIQAGGKGVNVARILRALGANVHSVVVVGGETGEKILDNLHQVELQHTVVYSPGNSRTYFERIAVGHEANCTRGAEQSPRPPCASETRAPAPPRSTREFFGGLDANTAVATTLLDVIDSLLPNTRWLAVCGSLAPGLPENLIAKIIARCRERRVFCAVDSHGPALTHAWRAGPDLLRVNRDEAAEALRCAPHEISIERCFALGHATRGVISDGENPFLAWGGILKRFRVTPPHAHTLNPTGCGDAMLAGLMHQLENTPYCRNQSTATTAAPTNENQDPALFEYTPRSVGSRTSTCNTHDQQPTQKSFTRALRFATALAAAEAEAPFAGHPDLARAKTLEPQVQIRTLP